MPDQEIDAEDGEVREPPVVEDKRDEKRKPNAEDLSDRGASKKHKSDRDRSRSRERSRVDRERERDREKRVSYDQVSYSGDTYDKYDRYAAATAERDVAKARKDRGERDERSRRSEYDKDVDAKDREKRRERDELEKDRERRKERDDKEIERRKDRDEDPDKDRRKERDRGREKERSRDRGRTDKDPSKKSSDDTGKDRDNRRDERGDQRRRSRSRDRNRGKEGSDRYDDRHDRKKDRREKDVPSKSGSGEVKTPRDSNDKEEIMLQDDEEDLETIRKKRAAILAKIKSKSAANGAQGAAAGNNLPGTISKNQSMEDIFEDQKAEQQKPEEQKAHDSGDDKPAQAEAEDVEDKDEIETANVFAAKEHGGESDDDGQDDMFTNSPARGRAGGAAKAAQRPKEGEEMDRTGIEEDRVDRRLGDTNADNWDDAEGYFRTRPGELIIGRYLVNRDIGNGVYSTVLSATDQQTGREVAIKVVRSNETMTTAGRKEIEILKKLGAEDPEGRRHICKLLSHFEYKNHLCMVFVPLEMNLRKLLKTYGREVGITLSAIRQYTRQLLIGLQHMVKCKVVHGDIKLDNIVITKDLKNVAICDFGTADWESECVITPYMVSRYYRPPEICLGLRYGYAMDLWSVGVCLFELYTGKFMFTGRNNNDMLKQFMDYKGAPNKRFLKKGQFFDQHFEEEKGQVVFKWLTQDKVTKAEIIEKKIYDKPVKSIYEQLRKVRSSSDDAKKVKEFSDLLEQIFILDPMKRISVSEALKHPFLR